MQDSSHDGQSPIRMSPDLSGTPAPLDAQESRPTKPTGLIVIILVIMVIVGISLPFTISIPLFFFSLHLA